MDGICGKEDFMITDFFKSMAEKKEVNVSEKSNFPKFFENIELDSEKQKKDCISETKNMGKSNFPMFFEKVIDISENSNFPYDLKGELLPNVKYESEGYYYSTDKIGRIKNVEGNLRLEDGQRNEYAQRKAGGIDRQESDQGGHLIARQFGGSGGLDNLVAMKGELNQGAYKKMEMDLKKALEDGCTVDTEIRVKYEGNSQRPSRIIVVYKIDGEKTKKIFDNN